MSSYSRRYMSMALLAVGLTGCAAQIAHQEGVLLIEKGDVSGGLAQLRLASEKDPGNAEYKMDYRTQLNVTIRRFLEEAQVALRNDSEVELRMAIQKIFALDPENERAKALLAQLESKRKSKDRLARANTLWIARDADGAARLLRQEVAANPDNIEAIQLLRTIEEESAQRADRNQLDERLEKSISIEFKDAPIRQVFEIFSRTAGVNFIFDKDVPPDMKTTAFFRNTTVKDALNLILVTNQLGKRVLDSNSVLLFQNTPGKLRDYQELSVKTFLLNNADAKSVGNTIKTIVKTKDMIIDEQQNMLIVRDTPEAIRLAERLVALHDQPQAEVMLEVEVLEVNRNNLTTLGVQWPGRMGLIPLPTDPTTGLTLSDLRSPPSNRVGVTLAPVVINANKTDSFVNLLANPRIRTRSKEIAKIMIGERLPNISTTATATGFVAENIQYIDVGLKLEVQPVVYPNNEVVIKLGLEVSSVGDLIKTSAGTTAYQIGTRNASTVLRLRDGENQILAGLLSNEERISGNRVPGFGDIPVLGRLFGSQANDNQKTEIVLSITPHLIRNIISPSVSESEFESGTEVDFKVGPTLKKGNAKNLGWPGVIPVTEPGSKRSNVDTISQEIEKAPDGLNEAIGAMFTGPQTARVGKDFSVSLFFAPSKPVKSVPYELEYDPTAVRLISAIPGGFLGQDGARTSYSNNIDSAKGRIVAIESRVAAGGVSQPGKLVTLKFQSLKVAKDAGIRIASLKPQDSSGDPFTLPNTMKSAYPLAITE